MDDPTNTHSMVTRSKKNDCNNELYTVDEDKKCELVYEQVDNDGNLTDLIDSSCNADFDNDMFQKELLRLRGNKHLINSNSPKKNKKKKKKKYTSQAPNILDIILPYILMTFLGESPRTKKIKKKKSPSLNDILNNLKIEDNVGVEVMDHPSPEAIDDEEDIDDDEEDIDDEEEAIDDDEEDIDCDEEDIDEEEDIDDDEEDIDDEEEDIDDDQEDIDDEDVSLSEESVDEDYDVTDSVSESGTDSDTESEYDEYDDQFVELIDLEVDGEEEINYFHNLNETDKVQYIKDLEQIKEINRSNIPMRFKVLNSHMDIKTKSIAIDNIEKLNEMDISTGEYCKMDKWISGLIKIPFGNMIDLPINNNTPIKETRSYLVNTQKILDKAIYGHKEAKMHILQVIGKWIRNPQSQGNVLALQGPMGNGKTTLVKDGIAKAINRPFAFIALGGASDSSFFDGHSYTYEGSHWGRIIDILIESKCMNPIIYFDELDKVSDTHKGEEIIHLLTHLTDPSQNTLFQDNYFPGVHIDLSKALFIFSFNDETNVDRILKDRMYVINTKGFKPEDKISICKDYILPELLETFMFDKEEITFSEESLLYIIDNYTVKEEGVRNLKRCLETIISKINIFNLSQITDEGEDEKVPLTFEIKDFSIPMKITDEIVRVLLDVKDDIYKAPEHMYM